MIVYGCKWVCMGAIMGRMIMGGGQKQGKNVDKRLSMSCFCMHGQDQKMPHVGQDDFGVQGGPKGEIKWKRGGRSM